MAAFGCQTQLVMPVALHLSKREHRHRDMVVSDAAPERETTPFASAHLEQLESSEEPSRLTLIKLIRNNVVLILMFSDASAPS